MGQALGFDVRDGGAFINIQPPVTLTVRGHANGFSCYTLSVE